jgi:hypothetical protein
VAVALLDQLSDGDVQATARVQGDEVGVNSSKRTPSPDERWPAMAILPRLDVPRLTNAVVNCLERQSRRRASDDIAGCVLYVPRLGASVLPHVPVAGGWLCTFVAAESGARLPVGAGALADVELRAALSVVNPWCPHASLTGHEFIDVWTVRVCDGGPRLNPLLVWAIAQSADRQTLRVITGGENGARLRSRAHLASKASLRSECDRLVARGFLVKLCTEDPAPDYGLICPKPRWPT